MPPPRTGDRVKGVVSMVDDVWVHAPDQATHLNGLVKLELRLIMKNVNFTLLVFWES